MRIPLATYRIQFNRDFTFQKAKEIVSYLAELGITDLYASPIFKAKEASTHGYDIVDPNQLNPELGTFDDFIALSSELKQRGLFWIQDIVPNHMAYDSQNQLLMDVLENGRDSAYFGFFDIDWEHPYENLRDKVLTPLLGKFYAESLEQGEISLKYGEKGITINYYGLSLPLKCGSYDKVLGHDIRILEEKLGSNNADFISMLGAINLFKALSSREGDISQSEQIRHAKNMLWSLYNNNPAIREFIEGNIALFNGSKDNPASYDRLDELISEQRFRLSFWKVAAEEINYRRFFTVNELISLKVEDDAVFSHIHELTFKLINEGLFHALRVDHIDGLHDPESYLNKLREKVRDTYLVVEKIVFPGERLSSSWPVQGTTGYDFLNYLNGIFVERRNLRGLTKIYQSFTRLKTPYEDLLCDNKRMIISKHLAGNVDNLAQQIKKLSSKDRYGRDITLYGLKRALVEVMAVFPVYRTYINQANALGMDRRYIQEAISRAKKKLPGFIYELDFIGKFLLLEYNNSLSAEDKQQWIEFVMNFQQYTGPLMAKGFEDTILYIYNRLISLNEVGSAPQEFGFSLEDFYGFLADRFNSFRYSFNATSTHDTKRSEDVRARINVLSEMPREWDAHLKAWEKLNKNKKVKLNNRLVPDENDEYFLYQTLLGALPFEGVNDGFRSRIKEYIIKAVREAKRHTAWIKPDSEYENACEHFIEGILDPSAGNRFLEDFLLFQKKVAFYGMFNSLSQLFLKITSPGVADFYQGAELWDFSLVDPDNRRRVDFSKRISFLSGVKTAQDPAGLLKELFSSAQDGRIKMFLVQRLLAARKANPELFLEGGYFPLKAEGKFQDNVVAFARQFNDDWMICITARFFSHLVKDGELPLGEGVWQDTCVIFPQEASSWKDLITGRRVNFSRRLSLAEAFKDFPAALLVKA